MVLGEQVSPKGSRLPSTRSVPNARRHDRMTAVVRHRGRLPKDPKELEFTMFDIKGQMYDWLQTGGERFVQDAFHDVLDHACRHEMEPQEAWAKAVVIDIGSNSGFYGLLALAHGCAVVFVEPQPECNDLISMSIAASGFDERKVRRVKRPVGGRDSLGKSLEVQPDNHCEGRFPIVNKEHHHADAYGTAGRSGMNGAISVPFLQVEEMLQSAGIASSSQVLMLKLDTEGFELVILRALLPTLRTWHIANLIVEVTPMWWANTGFSLQQGAALIEEVASLGYQGQILRRGFGSPADIRTWIEHGRVYQDDLWLQWKR